jgi:hypothetical protein
MSKVESADLILKLYDLRREEKMREAREWIFMFNPQNVDDFFNTMMDPQVGPYLRMVTSYWEMAASFVNQGVIDAEMFNDITGEHLMVFAKIEPFLGELRERFQNPKAFAHLEKAILGDPEQKERLAKTREFLKAILAEIAQRQQQAAAAA